MKLKLQLVRDGEIIFEMPLSPRDWKREDLVDELDAFEEHFQRFSKIFTALASETRLMMMKRLMEEKNRTMNFTDFMHDLNLNPKLVWENTRKLKDGGLLEKIGRGRYRCSELGETCFIMMSFTLRRLLKTSEEIEDL